MLDFYVYCKAHPDEKGIETEVAIMSMDIEIINCKAHPDEKGIETETSPVLVAAPTQLQSTSRRKGN